MKVESRLPVLGWYLRSQLGCGMLLLLLLASPGVAGESSRDLPMCKESDYHFEYTECDSFSSRWRVAVPHTPGICTGLPDPVRGTKCSFSCKAGEFLDMKSQACTACGVATYSLGTGVRIDEWDELPPGFVNVATNLEMDEGWSESAENCTMSTWVARGDYIASNRDECTATLMYSVNLKQTGRVSFEYFYPDKNLFFEFFVQNDQCQSSETESRWMKSTDNGWEFHDVELSRGNNVLYWRTTGFSLASRAPKPVLLKNIDITGVAYTSECFPCKPGTFSNSSGSSVCQVCPRNTYSNKGAASCQGCNKQQYSEAGSGSCKDRPPCTDKDYFYTHTRCDADAQTQLMYKWIEPKICSEDINGAVKLPASGAKMPCPPCNPGFFKSNASACEPCPYGSYSNGSVCIKCPAQTEPVPKLEYKWWNTLPTNMETSVLFGGNHDNEGVIGWEVAGDHIYTAAGISDNDYMILTLTVPGFRPPQSVAEDSENKEVAKITFVFETTCTTDCELYFMVFQNREYTNDVAKIYSINVTNVINGVASYCRPCALGSSDSGSFCIPCPPGNYIDEDSSTCRECPVNTYLRVHHPYGKQACIPCGPGTQSNRVRTLCYNDCRFAYVQSDRTIQHDFSALENVTTFEIGPSFTPKGLQYFHQFNIGLCGNQGKKLAVCAENVTDVRMAGIGSAVTSFMCQSTIVPSDARGFKTVSSNPVNLADHLIGVTTEAALDNITSPVNLFPTENKGLSDVLFFYRSTDVTQSCSSGRATVVRMRCNPEKIGSGDISVPSKCPEGTCDGCTFHFLWETEEACPLCSVHDYHMIVSACNHGVKRTSDGFDSVPLKTSSGITDMDL
nr:PREDICTED: UPF0577 protein KIAA1324 homolog [Latimeria chalumnae]|eukprot:XP_014351906.1 PREDICTED: UPF0577 protein KIAA1324 homolog [Latimeria chalumnae]